MYLLPRAQPRDAARVATAAEVQRSVGARIAELRRAAGLTQDGLAAVIGVSARYVRTVEAGRVNLSIESLVTFATALGAEAVDLFQPAVIGPRRPGRPAEGRSKSPR